MNTLLTEYSLTINKNYDKKAEFCKQVNQYSVANNLVYKNISQKFKTNFKSNMAANMAAKFLNKEPLKTFWWLLHGKPSVKDSGLRLNVQVDPLILSPGLVRKFSFIN